MEYYECLPTLLNILAERICFSQVLVAKLLILLRLEWATREIGHLPIR
jgi:hypothetical protein